MGVAGVIKDEGLAGTDRSVSDDGDRQLGSPFSTSHANALDEHGLAAENAPSQSINSPSRRETLLLPQVPVGTHQLGAGNPDATKPFPPNAVISAIVHCVGEVAHWNERSLLETGCGGTRLAATG